MIDGGDFSRAVVQDIPWGKVMAYFACVVALVVGISLFRGKNRK